MRRAQCCPSPLRPIPELSTILMIRAPLFEAELQRVFRDAAGQPVAEIASEAMRVAQVLVPAVQGGSPVHQLIQQQIQLMAQQLALLSGSVAPMVVPTLASAAPAVTANEGSPTAAAEAARVDAVQRAMVDRPVVVRGQRLELEDPRATHVGFAVPANATELAIAAVWARLLNIERVGRNDNFFNLGGHSLLALRAVQGMQHITGEKIAISRLIFESLSQIAAGIAIESAGAAPVASPAVDVQAGSHAENGEGMTTLRFGHPASSLYGVFHPSGVRGARPRAVLFCNPFGQEAVRIHRFFCVLADRLARAGVACLRFDYHASGESLGEDHEADLDRWVQDVVAADALLRQRADVHEVDWVAPRLASALAVRASALAPQAPRQLVLWEPVISGAHYVEHLQAVHASTVANLPDGGALAGDEEILGFGVSRRLLEQLRAVEPADYERARARRVVVVAPGRQTAGAGGWAAVLQGRGVEVRRQTLSLNFDWTSEEAFNTALVPADALNLLAALLRGGPFE